MKKRDFLKTSVALASTTIIPSPLLASISSRKTKLRTAHIGVGGMGASDLESIASHNSVQVVALCDVDEKNLNDAQKKHPNAKVFKDYRTMLNEMSKSIWNIYKKYLGNVEIYHEVPNPMANASAYAKERPNEKFYAVNIINTIFWF